jgi:hypothetical protein
MKRSKIKEEIQNHMGNNKITKTGSKRDFFISKDLTIRVAT